MVRTTHIRRDFADEGSERAIQLGAALGAKCSAEMMEALSDAISVLNSIGGQIFLAAERPKFVETPEGLQELEDHHQPGKYVTIGYVLHYNHIATSLRAPKEPDSTPDDLPDPSQNGLTEELVDMPVD